MSHQLEQLLTCCICLDRFRNPKLLPCQHSVCMEPCMEGLVDYVRRQVKCPECRAEHRIPYNGVQGFPANVTLQRFLEAQIEITGETPDPHTGQFMERCAVCNEKDYLTICSHCEKKVCDACKGAHTDVLKREIGRINNQVKRAAHRLTEQLNNVDRNIGSLKCNTNSIVEEIENISKRLQKAIRDREAFLKSEVQNQYNAEMRSMQMLKDGLETEISNVKSNIEVADKHMDDDTPWDDAELMDTKDIFLKTMDFIRSFDYDTGGDYARKTRFLPPEDLNKLASSLSSLGELNMPSKHTDPYAVAQSFGNTSGGLSKSKSDHRLAVQFREQEEASAGRTSPSSRRRFGDRPPPVESSSHDYAAYESSDPRSRRFRSRFMKREEEEEKGVRFTDDDQQSLKPQRSRCIDTEDASRGPLSGIVRILDSPRAIQRLMERDALVKKKKEDAGKPKPPPTPVAQTVTPLAPPKANRQISEDEIDKIKKQNKVEETSASGGASATATPSTYGSSYTSTTTPAPSTDTDHSYTSRPSQDDDSSSRRRDYSSRGATDYGTSSTANGTSSRTPSRKSSIDTGVTSVSQRSQPFSRSSSTSSIGGGDGTKGRSSHTLDTSSIERRLSRSNSNDSNKSGDGSSSRKAATGAAFSTEELKNKYGRTTTDTSSKSSTSSNPNRSSGSGSGAGGSSRFQSRFLGRAGTPSVEASKESGNDDDEEESSEESESDDSEESSEEEEDKSTFSSRSGGGLLGRSAQNQSSSASSSLRNKHSTDSGYGSRYSSSNDNSSSNRYGSGSTSNDTNSTSSYGRRPSVYDNKKEEEDKYTFAGSKYLSRNAPKEEEKPAFQSRFLNRSKSSAILAPDALAAAAKDDDNTPAVGSSRARFDELKERRQRLARSKSSAGLDEDETSTTDNSSPSTYKSKYSRDNDTSSSLTSRTLGGSSAASSSTAGREEGGSSNAQLSNWARYLKNKYGNKSESASGAIGGSSASSASTTGSSLLNRTGVSSLVSSAIGGSSSTSDRTARAIARSRSSHLLGLAKDGESSEDDSSKNVDATPIIPALPAPQAGILVVPTHHIGSIHRNQYLKKQHLILQIGSRGSEPGNFIWPRGVAIGPDNSIVVADSSNHRVQVFDHNGHFIKEFGSYGSQNGEFDCLAGVAVNRIGQYIIADRYNHRIQVFDPSGMFLRSFGSQGSGDSRFSYPWGVTTDALGFIYVCDKENHRVQVFQSDGTFVGKFGSLGSKPGQLEHPHYIAVSSTNRVIVSDSNNHRIQIFDINGKVQTTFGREGAEEGQFKFPRGVAVDEQGFIMVADCGNNRIQVFTADGVFLRAFGCWGSQKAEFKGLEGVAVMPNGNILVCDRENHRVQVF